MYRIAFKLRNLCRGIHGIFEYIDFCHFSGAAKHTGPKGWEILSNEMVTWARNRVWISDAVEIWIRDREYGYSKKFSPPPNVLLSCSEFLVVFVRSRSFDPVERTVMEITIEVPILKMIFWNLRRWYGCLVYRRTSCVITNQ